MKKNKYIVRCDKYWHVKIRIGPQVLHKCFSFSKYDGIKNALEQAIQWRNDALEQHGQLDRLGYKKAPDRWSTKTCCPIIGVYRTYTKDKGKIRYNWTARISHKGKEVKRHFSIRKYGEREAFLKACITRKAYCGTLMLINKKLIPT
jgi:hypothetical protein